MIWTGHVTFRTHDMTKAGSQSLVCSEYTGIIMFIYVREPSPACILRYWNNNMVSFLAFVHRVYHTMCDVIWCYTNKIDLNWIALVLVNLTILPDLASLSASSRLVPTEGVERRSLKAIHTRCLRHDVGQNYSDSEAETTGLRSWGSKMNYVTDVSSVKRTFLCFCRWLSSTFTNLTRFKMGRQKGKSINK